MSPLPVIDNCFRIALTGGQYMGVRPVNVFHVLTATANVPDIGASILEAAEAPNMMAGRPESAKPIDMDITPLDGTSASVNFSVPSDSFTTGTGDGQCVPEAAAVVSFHTMLRGPAHRGRLFNGPLVESAVANGKVEAPFPADMLNGWLQFMDLLAATDPAIGLCVASYKLAEATLVSSVSVSVDVATQRRRLLQTR